MQPTLRQSIGRCFLIQSAKTLSQIIRIYSDKGSEINLPPEPTTCCMSGCANCVWIGYAAELAKLFDGNDEKVREIILNKITDPNLKMFLSIELRSILQRTDSEKK